MTTSLRHDSLPMNTSTNPTANAFKYTAKELSLFRGLPVYDYTARHTLPAAGNLFRTMDPHSENEYSVSPYSFCLGDPVNKVDPSGKDAIVLLDDSNFIGHTAMLIENENGQFDYYSINGTNMVVCGWRIAGQDQNDVAVEGNWSDAQEFLDSDFNSESGCGYNYSSAMLLETTPEQDQEIKQEFSNIAENESYNPLFNNCAHTVQRSLIAGGIKVAEPETYSFDIMPTSDSGLTSPSVKVYNLNMRPKTMFNSISSSNPNATIYKK